MKNKLITAAIVAALLGAAQANAASSPASKELEEMRAQLQALQSKVDAMERAQRAQADAAQAAQAQAASAKAQSDASKAQLDATEKAADKAMDAVAQLKTSVASDASRFAWKGDIRVRAEDIKQQGTVERERDRFRVRAGFTAKVNDTVKAEVQLTTGESLSAGGYGDARSPNQTFSDANSRKRVWFDTAFIEWAPNAQFKTTFGKMRYPWVRPTNSAFYDSDINPEGIAFNWQQGPTGLFAAAWYLDLAERAAGTDSTLSGGQVGWRADFSGTKLTLAAGYFDHGGVQGYNAVQDGTLPGNAFGNTTTALATVCRLGIATCIANDYNIVEVLGDLTFNLGGKPLNFSADYAKNNKADFSTATIPSGLDTAWMAGVQYGKVTTANTWEASWTYEKVENDALYNQWVDSDYGGGSTGFKGSAFRFNYGLGKNFRLNSTYFLNRQNIDLPATVNGVAITDRHYNRWQLDLLASF